jgi:putative oxidoreductase
MTVETESAITTFGQQGRPLLRAGVAGLLLVPGASKFLTYGTSVRFFESIGLPWPGLLVPLVGAVELSVATLLLFDRGTRIAAIVAILVMVVAVATAGVTFGNVGVIVGAISLVGLDTWEVQRAK